MRTTVRSRKPVGFTVHDHEGHGHAHGEVDHRHEDGCGHLAVKHQDHWDYIVDGELHHYDEEGNKCDVHGELDVHDLQSLLRSSTPSDAAAGAAASDHVPSWEETDDGLLRRNYRLLQHARGLQALDAHAARPNAPPWYRDRDSLRFVAMMFLTGSFLIVELVVGVAIGSLVLQADAFHMLSDMVALSIGFYSLRSSKRAHSSTASFGYARFEVVGSLVNAVFLLATAFQISLEAVTRLSQAADAEGHHGAGTGDAKLLMIVGGVGLAINVLGLFVFASGHGHGHTHGGGGGHSHGAPPAAAAGGSHGHSHMSMNLQGVLLHVLGDALGSVAVLVSGAIMAFTAWPRKELSDPLASLVIVLIIATGTVPLLKSSSHILLEKVPHHVDLAALRRDLLALPGVLSLHDLHVWDVSPGKTVGTLHLMLDRKVKVVGPAGVAPGSGDLSYKKVVDSVKSIMHKAGVHASTVQPEWVSPAVQEQLQSAAAAFLADLAGAKARGAIAGGVPGGSGGASRAASPDTLPELVLDGQQRSGELKSGSPVITVVRCAAHATGEPPSAQRGEAPCGCSHSPALDVARQAEQRTNPMLLSLDMCNEIVCGEACVEASCCPQPQVHHSMTTAGGK